MPYLTLEHKLKLTRAYRDGALPYSGTELCRWGCGQKAQWYRRRGGRRHRSGKISKITSRFYCSKFSLQCDAIRNRTFATNLARGYGSLSGTRAHTARLTGPEVLQIRALDKLGCSTKEIIRELEVPINRRTIRRSVTGESWNHLRALTADKKERVVKLLKRGRHPKEIARIIGEHVDNVACFLWLRKQNNQFLGGPHARS